MSSIDQRYEERPWDFPFDDDGGLRKAPSRAHLGCLPWERPRKWPRAFFSTAWMIVAHPVRAFSYEAQGSWWRPWFFLWLIYFAEVAVFWLTKNMASFLAKDVAVVKAALLAIGTLLSSGFVALALLLLPLAFGFVAHAFIRAMAPLPEPIRATYRALCYSQVSVLFLIPFVLLAITAAIIGHNTDSLAGAAMFIWVAQYPFRLYAYYLAAVALDSAHDCGKFHALAALFMASVSIGFLLGFGFFFYVSIHFDIKRMFGG